MTKVKILFIIMILMLSSALKTDSKSLDDDEVPLHSSSNNEKLILDSQAFIDVFLPNGNVGNFDSFAVDIECYRFRRLDLHYRESEVR